MLRRLKGTPKLSEMIYKILYKDMCIFLGREDNFHQSLKGSRDPKRLETTVPQVSSNLGRKHFDHFRLT